VRIQIFDRVSNGVSPIFLVFQASTRVSMGRADVPSAGLGWREKRQPSTMLRPGGLSASTARFYGDATGVASLQGKLMGSVQEFMILRKN
jgi:hypothetical protein